MNLVLSNDGMVLDSVFLKTHLNSDLSVYEVFRLIDGVALFLEDHFNRLIGSIQIQGLTFQMSFQDFKENIAALARQNHRMEGNIKFIYSIVGGNEQWAFSFIPHSYPSPDDYKNGVTTDLLFAERQNPNAKVVQTRIWDKANQMISDRNLYEVLLVDRDGMITEGSRSNVFFVKGDVFYTAPASMVLVGITRQKVLDCIKILGFCIIEQAVSKAEISEFDAVFLTGTSPKVLPARVIGKQMFDVQNNAVLRVMDSYDQLIRCYIQDEMNQNMG
jgi:branched-chain amino acid aminotransferase